MITVHKYPVAFPADEVEMVLPRGAKILKIAIPKPPQLGVYPEVFLWALVDTDEVAVQHTFLRIAGTGHNLTNEELTYIDTFFLQNGASVFHVFEIHV